MELPTLTRLWQLWERLWFSPADPRSLAWLRISLGLMLIVSHVLAWPELDFLYGAGGPMDEELLTYHWTPYRISHLTGLSSSSLHAAYALTLAVYVSFTLGFQTRLSNLLALAALIGTWHASPWVQNGGDRLLRIWTLTLLLAPSGAAWSVDAWLAERRGLPRVTEVPVIAHRLIQLQLVVMYTATGILKLLGETWRDGSAIYYSLSDGSYARFPALSDAAMGTVIGQWSAIFLTYGTLVFEVGFLPLVMWRRTRLVTLLAGVALHGGIWVTLSVGLFSWASVWGYPAFYPTGLKPRPRPSPAEPSAASGAGSSASSQAKS